MPKSKVKRKQTTPNPQLDIIAKFSQARKRAIITLEISVKSLQDSIQTIVTIDDKIFQLLMKGHPLFKKES